MRTLVLNCGSSSIKYRLFDGEQSVTKGIVERIGQHDSDVADHRVGLQRVMDHLGTYLSDGGLDAIGHRVVHGGEEFVEPTPIDSDVIERIRAQIPLAPLHNPANLLGIEVAVELHPDLRQVAVFDTAFHRSLPPRAFRYAIPEEMYRDHGVRRYGFHGTSHSFVAQVAAEHLGRPLAELNMITLHLGNGASATAIEQGRSVDTSMGLSPLEGLVMGSRSGDIDPAIVFHLERSAGLSNDEVESMLNRRSGLLGLCGDMDLREVGRRAMEGDADAALALDVYGYRIKKYVGAYLAALLLSVAVWRRLGAPYAVFVVLSILLPSASGTGSIARYVVVLFPIFMLLGAWGRRAWLDRGLTISFALLLGVFATAFVNWVFVA